MYAAIAVHTLIASGTYLVAKGAMSEFAPLVFAFYRFCLASLVFIVIIILRRDYFSFNRSEWLLLAFLGIMLFKENRTPSFKAYEDTVGLDTETVEEPEEAVVLE